MAILAMVPRAGCPCGGYFLWHTKMYTIHPRTFAIVEPDVIKQRVWILYYLEKIDESMSAYTQYSEKRTDDHHGN